VTASRNTLRKFAVRIVETRTCARIGLLGNPSDGFFGKTISASIRDFGAGVVLYEWPELEIVLGHQDRGLFNGIDELVADVKLNGLYGGLRLIKASIKRFAEYCREEGLPLSAQNFSLRYETDIPRQGGLAGSSAIITAAFRALMEFYDIDIPNETLANLILEVETKEIGIEAGLQDRVCQVYGGLVFMDFNEAFFMANGHGRYQSLDPNLLPPLFLAYRGNLSQISGIYHSNLRERWRLGEPKVVEAMQMFGELAEEGLNCLLERDHGRLAKLMDRNFDIRSELSDLDPANVQMVHLARRLGLCAKYAGSGGAIVGICEEDDRLLQLKEEFGRIGCRVIRPTIQKPAADEE
jgi:glucuronokinase